MVRKSSIIPTDISSSREYYGLNNSQDIYKGTSFKFSGEWASNTHYFNDEYIVDFVVHPYVDEDGRESMAMWACNRNHLSSVSNEPQNGSRYWTFVMSGASGQDGKVYVPYIDGDQLKFDLVDATNVKDAVISLSKIKGDKGLDGRDGTNGVDGKDGKDGKVYIPSVKDGVMTFVLSDSGRAEYKINVDSFKGEKGDAGKPIEVKVESNADGDRILYYRVEGATTWKQVGEVGGKPGKSVKLTVWNDSDNDIRNDKIIWGYDGDLVSEWSTLCYLDDLRGDTISNVELNDNGQIEVTTSYRRKTESGDYLQETGKYTTTNSVFPEFKAGYTNTLSADDEAKVTVSKTGDPKEWELNFSIPRGRDASIAVVKTTTVEPGEQAAVYNEGTATNAQLRFEIPKGEKGDKGDENVHIGCEPPTDTSMIWYNPCEQTLNGMTALDFLYQAYLGTPGKRVESNGEFKNIHLEKDLFEMAIGNISPINGFEIRVKSSFEALGEPTRDKLGFIYVIPSSTDSYDMYEEWIVVDTGETEVGADSYKWEKWGSSAVNLENYYTKDQVEQIVTTKIQQVTASFNGGEIDSSSWEL